MKKGLLLTALLAYGCADVSSERSGSHKSVDAQRELELNIENKYQ